VTRATSPWLTLDAVLRVTGGRLLHPAPTRTQVAFTCCAIDSRALAGGELFVPLPGTRTDGHEFVTSAIEGKAGGSLVADRHPAAPAWASSGKPVIAVSDPLRALQDLGRHCREGSGIPAVAVTGSNGKTTTKEMIAAVLGERFRVHRNVGNLNNHIGLPLTLTALAREDGALVVEMGMSARGEIAELARICAPNVGVLTNASAAHLASLGTVEEVARAKSELAESLPPDGFLVLNADDPLLWGMNRGRPVAKKSYALDHPDADLVPVRIDESADEGTRFALADGTEVTLRLLGRHNVRNALAAILVGDHFRVPRARAAAALGALRPARHRLELLAARGLRVIDDAYNANPASMREALLLLGSLPVAGARRAVLGDMLELGPDAERYHEEAGRGVPRDAWLYAAGSLAEAIARGARSAGLPAERIRTFASGAEMAEAVAEAARAGDLILVKASRGMRLEQVVERLVPGHAGISGAVHAAGRS